MKAAELKLFKEALLAIRARLRGDVSTMADSALRRSDSDGGGNLSTMPIHMADLGSDAFEQEFTLSLMATEEGTLEAVDEALERIRGKSFGLCEGCGGIIARKRLEAIPFAALCIRCAEREESHGPVIRTPVQSVATVRPVRASMSKPPSAKRPAVRGAQASAGRGSVGRGKPSTGRASARPGRPRNPR